MEFPITQILREIIFKAFRRTKSAISTHSGALNCDFYAILHFLKAEIDQINKIQIPYNYKFEEIQFLNL